MMTQICKIKLKKLSNWPNQYQKIVIVNVSGIVPRYGKLNKKMGSVNRVLQIYCRNMGMRFVGHENINPRKHMNHSDLHLNHLGTPILTVNFLNVLNSLDSEQ